ncbi:MAG TPA: thiamine-phosphate kinase, partial [Acinetobacter ursingii]|nr:thiamine-phosphate kinase [Acinetobacter ursingii]
AGGDDYELCFTISPQNYEKLLQQQLNVNITMIGLITQATDLIFEHDDQNHPVQFHGYQHFA